MVLWIVLACFTAGVTALLIAPLMKASHLTVADGEDEAAVYRDQLREIDRDLGQGLIGAEDAGYARAEIGRRLLAVADAAAKVAPAGRAPARHRLATAFVILCLPVTGLCLYVTLGSPGLPSQPLEARLANPGNDMALLVAKAERHLAQNPNDGAGWDLLAPIYFRTMRLPDADQAYRNAIRLLGESPQRLAGFGETLVATNDGIVTEEARVAFERAVALDAGNMRARFYVALALEQAGRAAEARGAFEALARDSPPGAAWASLVNEHIAKNGGAPLATAAAPQMLGNPSAEDVAAAKDMSPADRSQMIKGMIDSLAAKLKDDPNNIEGWLRLVRSYQVMGDATKASEALQAGLKTFPADGEPGRRLLALAREIGIPVEGATQ
ncbi:c-type cytochrome biogenesis protein CcmI [Rhizobium sp. FY34]|uniref:c-type cytochrome biogenesis protein CcmI n=1 Tax=Rhizobium sp. FY34 TaxID=2562309 RepID=UPI0010C07F86|nr:c-type cytochrome biogenesis protein CcmI [Rhizobium sp. FY34]